MHLAKAWGRIVLGVCVSVWGSGCSLVVPKTILIDKATLTAEVNKKLPVKFGLLTIEQPQLDFIAQRQCVQIKVDLKLDIMGRNMAAPVSTCSGIRFDPESREFFLVMPSNEAQTSPNAPSVPKPLTADLSQLARNALNAWTQKFPIYTIPNDKLVRYGYTVKVEKVTIVDAGILLELH